MNKLCWIEFGHGVDHGSQTASSATFHHYEYDLVIGLPGPLSRLLARKSTNLLPWFSLLSNSNDIQEAIYDFYWQLLPLTWLYLVMAVIMHTSLATGAATRRKGTEILFPFFFCLNWLTRSHHDSTRQNICSDNNRECFFATNLVHDPWRSDVISCGLERFCSSRFLRVQQSNRSFIRHCHNIYNTNLTKISPTVRYASAVSASILTFALDCIFHC